MAALDRALACVFRTAPPQPAAGHSSPVEPQVWDRAGAMKHLGLSEDVFHRIVKVSLEEIESRGEAIGQALGAGDLARAAREAHTLKSSSASLGALECRDILVKLEQAARAGDLDTAARHYEGFKNTVKRLREAVTSWGGQAAEG
ncbi:MAG: Hpt domain-containing protein [Thermodesulfobacteriota bacterium]